MFGIKKERSQSQYRLARSDNMLEDLLSYAKGKEPPTRIEDAFIKQFEAQVKQEYDRLANELVAKKYESLSYNPKTGKISTGEASKTSRQRRSDWYPKPLAEYILTRYRTVTQIMERFGYTQESVRTYIKNMRKAGLKIKTRGRAPTQYKIDNPHNCQEALQIIRGETSNV